MSNCCYVWHEVCKVGSTPKAATEVSRSLKELSRPAGYDQAHSFRGLQTMGGQEGAPTKHSNNLPPMFECVCSFYSGASRRKTKSIQFYCQVFFFSRESNPSLHAATVRGRDGWAAAGIPRWSSVYYNFLLISARFIFISKRVFLVVLPTAYSV